VKRRDLFRLPVKRLTSSVKGGSHVGPRSAPGSAPGTLPGPSAAPPPAMYVMAYSDTEMTEFPLEDLTQLPLLRGRWRVIWLNVDGVTHGPTLKRVGEILSLHRLALEDATEMGQARTHVFDDHMLFIAKMPRRCPELDVEQVAIFTGGDFVVSFQQHPGDSLDPVRERIRRSVGRIRRAGPDYLSYALLDAMVDNCFPVVEHYMEAMDELEEELLSSPGRHLMPRLHALRRDLLTLRRAMYPMSEAVRKLVREPPERLISPDTIIYLRDVQDHAVQVVDLVETCRELGTSLAELYAAFIGNRANDIMKVLTVFAALFIPLGFITSLYGMNVDLPPAWLRDLRVAGVGMAAITVGLLLFFWNRGWMGSSR
jgi:magnesium transporter